jgi:hypothetical protein
MEPTWDSGDDILLMWLGQVIATRNGDTATEQFLSRLFAVPAERVWEVGSEWYKGQLAEWKASTRDLPAAV